VSAKLREVARRYAWQSRQHRGLVSRDTFIMRVRLRELERFFEHRYGPTLPDDDAGRDDLFIAAHTIGGAYPFDVAKRIVAWAKLWCPWMDDTEMQELAERVSANPHRWQADTQAGRLGLTDAERSALRITTIGAVDVSKAERVQRRKRRARERAAASRQRRRRPKAEIVSRTRPWEALGISRSTWYRRKKRGHQDETKTGELGWRPSETKTVRSRWVVIGAYGELSHRHGSRPACGGPARRRV
jgi:hypothetical protein